MSRDKLTFSIGNSSSTTSTGSITGTDTSVVLTSDTNFAAKSGEGMIIMDEGQASEELAYSTGKTGSTLAIPLANRGLEGGSAQAHSGQFTVKGVLTAGMWNDVIDSLTNVLVKATGAVDTTKIVTLTAEQTLTNKTLTSPVVNTGDINTPDIDGGTVDGATIATSRINPRIVTTTDDATSEINCDTTDQYQLTAVANDTTFTVAGTPVAGQKLIVRLKDAGAPKNLTWTGFTARGATPPAATTTSKTHYVGFIYNATATTWDCVAAIVEA